MITNAQSIPERRAPLTKERVLEAAVDLADRGGIDALSMRKLGQELRVDAMAVYRHVRNKDDILDGIVDVVVGAIDIVPASAASADWKSALRQQILNAREEMLRHPWAPRLLEERTTAGPAVLGYIDAILGILRAGGFSIDLAHHTLHVLGSRILGFNQDLFDDSPDAPPSAEATAILARSMADRYPHVTEIALAASHDGRLSGCDDEFEFAFGLDLILDGLERLVQRQNQSGKAGR